MSENIITLKNGQMKDADTGKFISSPGVTTQFTKDNAAAMAKRRHEIYRRKAVQAILDEAGRRDPSIATGAAAFGYVVAKQYLTLVDSESPKFADVEKLGKLMTGLDMEDSQRGNAGATPGATVTASPAALMELVDLLEKRKAHEADKSRAIDGKVNGNAPTE